MRRSRASLNPSAAKAKKYITKDMFERYVGSPVSRYCKRIILTNFDHYLQRFKLMGKTETHVGSVMQVCHNRTAGVSMIDFSIGAPTAALVMELLTAIEPEAVLFLGMCGGLHESLKVGDFILPMAAIRDEGSSKNFMPVRVPALPTFKIQKFISQILVEKGYDYRTGVIHTTDYRFWEFDEPFKEKLYEERAIGIDMECASLFVTGFALRVPIGALLLVSDLPLKRRGIKTKKSASGVFRKYSDIHLELGIQAMTEIAERGEHIRHYRW